MAKQIALLALCAVALVGAVAGFDELAECHKQVQCSNHCLMMMMPSLVHTFHKRRCALPPATVSLLERPRVGHRL